MAFILLGVLGVVWPPGLACPHPFSFICWLWSCRCRACSYTWSASTVPSSGYLLVLVPLLLSHGPQLSNLGLQSASNSFFQLWCPCMGVLGLGSAVTLLETTLQSLLQTPCTQSPASPCSFVFFVRQGLSWNLELRISTTLSGQQALRICPSSPSCWAYRCLSLCPAFMFVLGNPN